MEKLLSVIVPSYNAQKFLVKAMSAICSIDDPRLEVLIVNDGSKDETAQVAQRYEDLYPNCIKAINQPNKGHGGAVNTGMEAAKGRYLKVLDADDWFDKDSLQEVLDTLQLLEVRNQPVDVFFTNYVYEMEGQGPVKTVAYRQVFPQYEVFEWQDTRPMPTGKYIMMHSIIYRTEFVRSVGLKLPEHTFYVDNLFVYQPLLYAKTMYYLDTDFYRYYVGRDDQSINEKVMMGRIDQQLRVNYLLVDATDPSLDLHPYQARYLFKHLEIVTNISSALLNRINTPESLQKKQDLWNYIKTTNPYVYRKLKLAVFGSLTTRNSKSGVWISNQVYKVLRKVGGYS